MKSYLFKLGISVLATFIIFTAGKSMFPYDFTNTQQQSAIETEFVRLYQGNQDITSPRARIIKDLKQLYNSENPPKEIVDKINSPDQYYPLLDDQMKDFLFFNRLTGNKLLTQEIVECSISNDRLYIDGEYVSQDLYRITGPGHNNYYQRCTKLLAETKLELKSSVPELLLKIEKGEYGKTPTQIPDPPTKLESFFGNLLSVFGIAKILLVFAIALLATFVGGLLLRAKSSILKKFSQLQPTKTQVLNPIPITLSPVSFLDEDEPSLKKKVKC